MARTIHISSRLGEILRDHIARLKMSEPDAWLFQDADGGVVRYSNWRKRNWVPALDDAGLGGIDPKPGIHDLRRLAATRMSLDLVDSRTMMHRHGSTTAALPLERYAQPDPAADKAQAERMADYIFDSEACTERASDEAESLEMVESR
jgi:integrase